MSLQSRLQLYLALIHLSLLGLALIFLRQQPWLMLGAEVLLLASWGGGVVLLRKAMLPLGFARQFHELLEEANYSVRMKPQRNRELNTLIHLFNHLLEVMHEERLRLGEQRGLLDHLLEATPSAVIVFDYDGKISLMNPVAKRILAVSNGEGKNLASLAQDAPSPELIMAMQQVHCGMSSVVADSAGRRFRLQRGQFIDRGFAREFLLIDEITDELLNSEKATYEKLVRVLAHEVNNTVAATGSVLESLLFYRDQLRSEDSQDFCTAIIAVQKRNVHLGEFIERFTRVVKMPEADLRPVDVAAVMDDIMYLYKQTCAEQGINLSWTQKEALPAQMLDRHLFEQAMMNVVKNAMEAVIEAQAGEPATRGSAPDQAYVHFSLINDAQLGVQLAVADSGKGLRHIPQDQLFTPFFTTKKGGQGVGLLFVREVFSRHALRHRLAINAQGDTQFTVWLTAGKDT